jgi:uncharacterized protein YjbI with pentapeptide repeats
LAGANLSGADLSGADLTNANVTNANLLVASGESELEDACGSNAVLPVGTKPLKPCPPHSSP